MSDETPSAGRIAPAVAAEFPELALWRLDVDALSGRSPDDVRERLRHLADRFRGAEAVLMRTRPIPHAYRVFFRHVGLDPDAQRTPVEQRALERLHARRLPLGRDRRGRADDRDHGDRRARVGARRGRARGDLEVREDAGGPARGRRRPRDGRAAASASRCPSTPSTKHTRRVALFSIQVAGVPSIHVGEALWMAAEVVER